MSYTEKFEARLCSEGGCTLGDYVRLVAGFNLVIILVGMVLTAICVNNKGNPNFAMDNAVVGMMTGFMILCLLETTGVMYKARQARRRPEMAGSAFAMVFYLTIAITNITAYYFYASPQMNWELEILDLVVFLLMGVFSIGLLAWIPGMGKSNKVFSRTFSPFKRRKDEEQLLTAEEYLSE
jgi:hypothetical protein